MRILFIAPLPPPTHGQSYVSQFLLNEIEKKWIVNVINTSKDNKINGYNKVKRIIFIVKMLFNICRFKKQSDVIYLTISQSFGGNIKDIFTYICLFDKLSKITIHLHGGSIRKDLWNKKPILFKINKYFIKKFGGVIISGSSHKYIFNDIIDTKKIHIVPNFSPSSLFISKQLVLQKFTNINPLRILYLSGLRNKKGYLDLFEAFHNLPKESQNKIRIDYAGAFKTTKEQKDFLIKIKNEAQIYYHGIVDELKKKELYHNSHIFCLPTKYFEGQPVSILEAYASGNVVITTMLGGVIDIFTDKYNGYSIKTNSIHSISSVIQYCLKEPMELKNIAIRNRDIAIKKYKKENFSSSIIRILENINNNKL